jgi:hypothetical protein
MLNGEVKLPFIMNKLEKIKEICTDLFGENYEIKEDNGYLLCIYFPEVTTINSKRIQHLHKDIFIYLEFNTVFKLRSLYAKRSTYSHLEYKSNYCHPHIYPDIDLSNKNMCLGGNTAISVLRQELSIGGALHKVEAFLYSLIQWIQWESIEGGPYEEGTKSLKYRNLPPGTIRQGTSARYYEEFIQKYNSFPLIFIESDKNQYSIPFNSEFETQCTELVQEQHLCIKTDQGYFSNSFPTKEEIQREVKSFNDTQIQRDNHIVFKDNKFYLTLYEQENQEYQYQKVCNTNISNYIKTRLEKELNERETDKNTQRELAEVCA